ncbi:hypothetical protein BOPS111487_21195 [Bordetella pseudohinzii]
MDHGLARAQQLGRAGVGAVFALAREPGHDDGGQHAEHDLTDDHGDVEARPGAALGAEDGAVDEITDHARQEDHEGVDHALDQGEGDHVAVGDVGDFVAQHGGDFFFAHAFEQAGGHGHQGVVLEGARGEGIGRAVIDGDLGAADAGAVGQLVDGVQQPGFALVARGVRVDDLRPGAELGHGLADQQRNNGAREAHDDGEHEQGVDIQALSRDVAIQAEDAQSGGQHQHHGQVGDQEQDDTFHSIGFPLRAGKRFLGPDLTSPVLVGSPRGARRRRGMGSIVSLSPIFLLVFPYVRLPCRHSGCCWHLPCSPSWGRS